MQAANAHLQDQLYATQQQLMNQRPNTVDAQALKRRLEDITKALLTYRVTYCYIQVMFTLSLLSMPLNGFDNDGHKQWWPHDGEWWSQQWLPQKWFVAIIFCGRQCCGHCLWPSLCRLLLKVNVLIFWVDVIFNEKQKLCQ